MGFLNSLTAFLPFGKKEEQPEYFFALNIAAEQLTSALWLIEGKQLKILDIASALYSSNEEIATVCDKLLDSVIGLKEIEPQKILFGVPSSWLIDENLKDEYLKILRGLVKELELIPMAYVATSHALINFLEKKEGVPPTAILVGFEKTHLTVTVVRAGKLDGAKVIQRGESAGADIEKALLTFTDVETLPSKILIYGPAAAGLKSQLLSFSWMSKLSFLHIPKIEVLEEDLEIKSVCLAGGSEIDSDIKFTEGSIRQTVVKSSLMTEEEKPPEETEEPLKGDNFGFVVGDVADRIKPEKPEEKKEIVVSQEQPQEKFNFKKFLPKGNFANITILGGIIAALVLVFVAFTFLVKADVKVFVEPKILEKDATVVADPNQKTVNEDGKIIPGQIVETEVSGSGKETASGRKQIGDPAKGTVVIRNKTDSAVTLSKGTTLTGNNQKFTLDVSVVVASRSAEDGTWSKATGKVTAVNIGADGNIPSGVDMTASGFTTDKIIAKSEGNFSGGTSKEVTVVSSEDQQRLLAKVSSDLRQQAQQKLQEKYPNKKILQEALSENIAKKSYNKNINDAAGEFSLNMTIKYKGTAFDDVDLRMIVSKLVDTQVPEGFQLDIAGTETQADVSKLEKDGRLIFLARFKAKMLPKIDTDKIKSQIRFKSPKEAADIIKSMDSVLGSEIKMIPHLPQILQRLPILKKNIQVEVGLK